MTDQASAPLVLASASPRRRELLADLGLTFEVVPSRYEEPNPPSHPQPARFAEELAEAKAREVAKRLPGRRVLGADTVVALGNQLLAKPTDEADAARMLRQLSGQAHQVVTGVALVLHRAGEEADVACFSVETEVTFRALAEAEIAAYIATGEPMDKAGAYGLQGRGGLLISHIRGAHDNVVGLPRTALALALRRLGYSILGVAG